MQKSTCPSCRSPLVIDEAAPPILTCPSCLATFRNPALPSALTAQIPVEAIPFAQEVEGDLLGSSQTIVVVAIVLIGGGVLWFLSTWRSFAVLPAVFGVALAAVAVSIVRSIVGAGRRSSELTPDAPADYPPQPGQILSYARPQKRPSTAAIIGRFVGGFFLGLAFCAVGVFLFGSTYEQPGEAKAMVFGIVVAGIVGLGIIAMLLEYKTGLIGFGRGTAVGLVLGLMALGPCALCYLG